MKKRIGSFELVLAVMMLLMIVVPNHSFAFKAPDEDLKMTSDLNLGLRSTMIRNINQPLNGDLSQAAINIVNNLMNVRPIGGKQSLQSGRSNTAMINESDARIKRIQTDRLGFKHIRLAQFYQGVPVVGAEIIVHVNNKNVIYQINGKYLPAIKVDVEPQIDADAALQIGLDEHQGKPGLRVSKNPSLVIYGSHLAYHYVISHEGTNVGQWWYYVDAHTGELISRYDNIQYVCPSCVTGSHLTLSGNRLEGEDGSVVSMEGWNETGGNYYLTNCNNVWKIYDLDEGDCEQNSTLDWGTEDRAAVSAGNNFEDTQDWVMTILGRDSFDDGHAWAQANVHEGTNYCNAYWDGTDFHFGDGNGVDCFPLTVLDVAAHEYGHALTQYTSNLIYAYEPGALNESYSDIMGAVVEFAAQPDGTGGYPDVLPGYSDWLMGEDAWGPDPEDFLRDMRDPHRGFQPSYYHGTYWYYGSGDNGGVHTNSGVQNFAFYLLAEGGTGTNDGQPYDITGIGRTAASEVAMRANTVYLSSSSQYIDSREAWISAADDLGYDTATVEDVWDAVGVIPSLPPGDLINDGSFENGPPPASAWTEWSSTGCEWIQNPSGVWGIPAYDGTYAFWAGGYCSGPNSNHVEQTIDIPAGATNLGFWMVFYRPDDDDPPNNDVFTVSINGTPIFTRDIAQANNTYPNWVEQVVDISTYAGQTVILRFEGSSTGDLTGNVLVDYIYIAETQEDPDIDVSPTSLEIWLPPNVTDDKTMLNIKNVGAADLEVSNICDEEVEVVKPKLDLSAFNGPKLPSFSATREAMGVKPSVDAQGDVIRQCNSGIPTTAVMGLHYVPSNNILYVVSEDGTGTIYKMDENCNVSGTLPGPALLLNGVTFDGQYLWVTDYYGQDAASDWLYKIDPNTGAVIDSWDLMPQGTDGILGIAWDGDNLWVSSVQNSTIFKLDTNANIIGSFGVSWLNTGLDWDGQYLISSDDAGGGIYRVSRDGNVVDSMPAPSGSGGFGVTCGGTPGQLWHSNYVTNTLYLVECNWCEGADCACDPDAPWMSVDTTSGTVEPGGSMEVTVTFDTTGMADGDYYGNIKITCNDPDEGCVIVPMILHVGECEEDDSGALDIPGTRGAPGGTATIPVRIQSAPNDVYSLGFEVFPPSVMTFTGFTRGPLVEDFDFFDCNIPDDKPNVVRCGGLKDEGGIAAGASGDVVLLTFDVSPDCEGIWTVGLQELKDDINTWSAGPGCFDCSFTCDINGDGEVTPQDALCAFQKYLGYPDTACGPAEEIFCDVTGDDDCTPQDALEIFKEYLGMESVCSPEE
jgi:Zn-dependent metalloprotease